ncbi:MAG: Hsp20 family protein [Acidobacteriota bacterium]|nr:MAG: Hsp20 family protein [Acidobacteriota bacterium]
MKPESAITKKETEGRAGSPIFVEAEKLIEQMQKLTQTIGNRAYEFFESRGRELGNELEDWFRAEAELLRPVPVDLKDLDDRFVLVAEAPGFKPTDIKISAEADRIILEGRIEEVGEEKAEKTIFSERRSNHFFRSLNLPVKINPDKVTASLKEGVLEVVLPKAPAREAVEVKVG